jgi:hypothetical protein
MFQRGDKVIVSDLEIKAECWGKATGIFYPAELVGIKLKNLYGIWSPHLFVETRYENL